MLILYAVFHFMFSLIIFYYLSPGLHCDFYHPLSESDDSCQSLHFTYPTNPPSICSRNGSARFQICLQNAPNCTDLSFDFSKLSWEACPSTPLEIFSFFFFSLAIPGSVSFSASLPEFPRLPVCVFLSVSLWCGRVLFSSVLHYLSSSAHSLLCLFKRLIMILHWLWLS